MAVTAASRTTAVRATAVKAPTAEQLSKTTQGRAQITAKLKQIIQKTNQGVEFPNWRWKLVKAGPGADYTIRGWEWSGDVKFKGNSVIVTSHGIADQDTGGA